jgi:Zn-finger nucleic acid-binding protein
MDMNCPICGISLIKNTLHSAEIDECPNCHGVWLSPVALHKAMDSADPDISWMDFELWKDPQAMQLAWGSKKCPQCSRPMAAVQYGATGVTVDVCMNRDGVWLDRGEFENILNALEDEATALPVPGYIRAALHEGRDLVTGQHGLASEWKNLSHVLRLLQIRLLAENPTFTQVLTAFERANPLR